jgi:hypothetical protein
MSTILVLTFLSFVILDFFGETSSTDGLIPPTYLHPGANPTIASYNASVVNFSSATDSLARFENKIIFIYFEKRFSLLQRWRCM